MYSPRRVRQKGSEQAAREHVEAQGEVWMGDDFVKTQGFAQAAQFPMLILIMAAAKDLLDLPLELTFVGILITTVLSLMITLVLIFWFFGKMSGVWYKKILIKWLWKRLLLTIIIEMLPFAKIIPATTILVLMAHHKENKLVQVFNRGLELAHGKEVTKMIQSTE